MASEDPPPLLQEIGEVQGHLDHDLGLRAEVDTSTAQRGEDSEIRTIVDQVRGNFMHEALPHRHEFVTAMIRQVSNGKGIQRAVVQSPRQFENLSRETQRRSVQNRSSARQLDFIVSDERLEELSQGAWKKPGVGIQQDEQVSLVTPKQEIERR